MSFSRHRLLRPRFLPSKRHDPGCIPALDRYDDPLWQTLRGAEPKGRRAKAFLSARFASAMRKRRSRTTTLACRRSREAHNRRRHHGTPAIATKARQLWHASRPRDRVTDALRRRADRRYRARSRPPLSRRHASHARGLQSNGLRPRPRRGDRESTGRSASCA